MLAYRLPLGFVLSLAVLFTITTSSYGGSDADSVRARLRSSSRVVRATSEATLPAPDATFDPVCPHEVWIDDPECDCGGCGPTWYAQADYLLWYASGMQLPPLVTLNDNDAPNLTEPDTRILFGGSEVFTEERSGGRIRIGTWLDCCNRCGLEAEYFGLENDSIAYFADSGTAGMAQLGRPFLDVNPRDMANNQFLPPQESAQIVSATESARVASRCKFPAALTRPACAGEKTSAAQILATAVVRAGTFWSAIAIWVSRKTL